MKSKFILNKRNSNNINKIQKKINELFELLEKAKFTDYEQALELSQTAYELAEKIDDEKSLACSLHYIGKLHSYFSNYGESLKALSY